jgi:hypothetical protein
LRFSHPYRSFAYPDGDYGPETLRLVAASGFARAPAAPMRAPVWDDSDPLQLPRVVIGNRTGATLARRIAKEFLG